MNKSIIAFVLILGSCLTASAQSIITRKDGTDIQAKILKVTSSEIKYQKYSNPDGPVFVMSKSDIRSVRYENGAREVFSAITYACRVIRTPLSGLA